MKLKNQSKQGTMYVLHDDYWLHTVQALHVNRLTDSNYLGSFK